MGVRPNTNNNIKMGRGGQEVLKMDDILASKALPLGKSQMQRQAMVREYVVKLAMILLEHISNHGFCGVDNFLGGQAGSLLLEEISRSFWSTSPTMASASSITSWAVRLALSSLRRSQLPTRVRGTAGEFDTSATSLTLW